MALVAVAVCAAAAAAFAVPSSGQPTGAGVRPGHSIVVSHNIDFVAVFGGTVGDDTTVEVFRGPVLIASAAGPKQDIAGEAGLEVNHGPLGAPAPGDCWDGITGDIQPGDRIVVTDSAGTDEILIDDILIDEIVPDPVAGSQDVLVRGHARRADGTPFPSSALDSFEWRDGPPNRGALASSGITVTGAGDFEARYTAASQWGLNRGSATQASVLGAAHSAGFGHAAPVNGEGQLVDGVGDVTNGPAPGCPAPGESNAVVSADDATINLGSGDLTVTGTKMTAASADVQVTLTSGAANLTKPATVTGNSWTLNVTRAELDGLPDGVVTVSAAFIHPAGTIGGRKLEIPKDTVAPDVTPDLAPGTYTGARSVALGAGAGDTILWGTSGVANRPYSGPIDLPAGTTTITARATDPAGNESPLRSFTYTVEGPAGSSGGAAGPAAGGAGGPAAGAPAGGGRVGGASAPNAPLFLQVSDLRTAARVRLGVARRRGILASFEVPEGANVVRAELYRGTRSVQGQRPVAKTNIRIEEAGRHVLRFRTVRQRRALRPGIYRLVIRAGTGLDVLNQAIGKRIRIFR